LPSVALAEQPAAALQGNQRPRILWVPPHDRSDTGTEAVGLAADVGLKLDPWEAFVLERSLNERADKWAAFEVGLLVSRQNGKGAILEARELAGLFLLDEQLILHSAHEYKTAAEGFRRILALIENSDMLRRRVKQVRTSHGEEGVELLSGQRLRFIARSTGSGRGFTGDCIILDEAYNLPDAMVEALMPTVSARPNPQLWYTTTAPDRDLAPCDHLARVRRRGMAGGDPGLFYAEWSIDPHDEFCLDGCRQHDDRSSVASWLKANPGAGIRISVEHMAREFAAMAPAGFDRERLGVGRWPTGNASWQVISEEQWDGLAEHARPFPQIVGPVALAAHATPDQSFGAIAVAGPRDDGLWQVEVVEHRPRISWMAGRLLELNQTHRPGALVINDKGPAGSLVATLEAEGVEVVKPTHPDAARACGHFYKLVTDAKTLRHLGDPALAVALSGAQRRPSGDTWTWTGTTMAVDISPLVAVTLALWGAQTAKPPPRPMLVVSNPDR
jgi:hypothetical protein